MAENEKYENKRSIMVSFGVNQFFGQWLTGPFGFYVFFFFKQEIGLNVILAMAAMVIYSVWNAVNDPLIGYLVEKIKMPWERKYGMKRFPWVIIGGIPWLFSYVLIYMVPLNWDPTVDPAYNWPVFAWYTLTIILFDFLFSLWNVNTMSMYPDKFKGLNERRVATGFGTIIGIIGIVTSAIIPPIFITENIPPTYRTAAWMGVGIGLIAFLLMLPGVFEGKKTRKKYELQKATFDQETESFISSASKAFKDRRFMVKVIFFFGYQLAVALLSASAQFMVIFVIGGTTTDISLFMAAMLIGALGSVPIWVWTAKRVNNNKKMSIYAGWIMFFTFLPIFFAVGYVFYLIALLLFGIGLGGQWLMDQPTMGDVLDDITIRTGKRKQAIYYGFQTFFIRFGEGLKVIIIGLVHIIVGFPEAVATLPELEAEVGASNLFIVLLGVRIHAALIPAILVLVTTLIFWKWYDLTPDLVAQNRKQLQEIGFVS